MRHLASLALIALLGSCAANSTNVASPLRSMPQSHSLGPTIDRASWNSGAIDTIVVDRTTLELHVGERLQLARTLQPVGRAAGVAVAAFVPLFVLEHNQDAVVVTEWGMQAIRPGTATLVVVPLVVPKQRTVMTRVHVSVHD